MSPFDFWHLYREQILRVAGILLLVGSVAYVIANGGFDGAYDTGSTLGRAMRNVMVGVIGTAVGVWAYRRFYWREGEASWRELTPEGFAIAGVIAMSLAVIAGAPNSARDRAVEDLVDGGAECFDQGSPMDALPEGSAIELSERQADRVHPELADAPPQVKELQRHYVMGRGRSLLIVSFTAVGDETWDPSFQSDLADARRALGESVTESELSGRKVLELAKAGSREIAILAPVGCNHATLIGRDLETTRALAAPLLDEIDPA